MKNQFTILDCTLRDGGYYTNWDFSEQLVNDYLKTFENLPVDYLEIGYRNDNLQGYFGEFYYCPISTLEKMKSLSTKKLAIILNEKDMSPSLIKSLLEPIRDYVTLVRMAIDPANFERALDHARVIKNLGFEIGFNVMYMSNWSDYPEMSASFSRLDGLVDYFYMVDSFGGVMPQDVIRTIGEIKSSSEVKIGFHGHNNLELALINTITAVEHGATIVDVTVTGMGRGAGNLSTELLMVYMASKLKLPVELSELASLSESFNVLKTKYKWGTSLPYMVSGGFSLAQKDVMSWIGQGFYSLNSIMNALKNKSRGLKDNVKLPIITDTYNLKHVLIVGGGDSVATSIGAILQFLELNESFSIIHVGSRHFKLFQNLNNNQFICMIGDEAMRLEDNIVDNSTINCIYPKYPRQMGTIVTEKLINSSFELGEKSVFNKYNHSALQIALNILGRENCRNIFAVGFDGYDIFSSSINELTAFKENEKLFEDYKEIFETSLISLTSTKYSALEQKSIFALI